MTLTVDPQRFTGADLMRCRRLIEERRQAAGLSPFPFTYHELTLVIGRMGGDLDLIADAMSMDPLPSWLADDVMAKAAA